MREWIQNPGKMPVSPNTVVELLLAGQVLPFKGKASELDWANKGWTHYRLPEELTREEKLEKAVKVLAAALETVYDSTAVLNHLDVEHQEMICDALETGTKALE